MHDGDEDDWWKRETEGRKANVRFFSDANKPEREAAPVRELLRYFGVTHEEADLERHPRDDDVDVSVFDARFQVSEHLDADRRRHDEFREALSRVEHAQPGDMGALEVPRTDSRAMDLSELVSRLAGDEHLARKTRKTAGRRRLDLLIYVNLRDRHLYPVPVAVPPLNIIEQMGWRSVAVLWPPHALVLSAQPDTPDFLRAHLSRCVTFRGYPWIWQQRR
jgi:hypothetical protein